jgi:hypothetical protein
MREVAQRGKYVAQYRTHACHLLTVVSIERVIYNPNGVQPKETWSKKV